jgi:hypothetical protein
LCQRTIKDMTVLHPSCYPGDQTGSSHSSTEPRRFGKEIFEFPKVVA